MTVSELTAGSLVTSHVRLVRKLGEGGMGSVWVADHLRLETEVAVKLIDPLLMKKHPSMKRRFQREATAAAKLKSPHVVRIFDHGETDDGVPFIVMELLAGEGLDQRLARTTTLGPRATERIVAQVCVALREAHGLGIVHRDIKPANLFLGATARRCR